MKTALYYFIMKQKEINVWITCALPNCIEKPDSWKYVFCSRKEKSYDNTNT